MGDFGFRISDCGFKKSEAGGSSQQAARKNKDRLILSALRILSGL
jgi:hypothetical protein